MKKEKKSDTHIKLWRKRVYDKVHVYYSVATLDCIDIVLISSDGDNDDALTPKEREETPIYQDNATFKAFTTWQSLLSCSTDFYSLLTSSTNENDH